jgi:hypothetical protein
VVTPPHESELETFGPLLNNRDFMRLHHILIPVVTFGAATALPAQAVMRPAPSTRAHTEVTLAYPQGQAPAGAINQRIRIDYGQPHLRGRTLHTDSLVPYDKPWRTGANAATRLVTEVDIVFGGVSLPAGTYVFFTLPSRSGWKLMIQKFADQTNEHDPALDLATIDLRTQQLSAPLESLTMWLIPSTLPGVRGGEFRMAWGTFSLSTDWSLK